MPGQMSTSAAVPLTVLFGGPGLFFASLVVRIVVSTSERFVLALKSLTLGLRTLVFPVVPIVAPIQAVLSAGPHNEKLISRW